MACFKSRNSSRVYSPGELLQISEQISRDYKPAYSSRISLGYSRLRLSAQEMLSISEEISREYASYALKPVFRSEIVLLPVDPTHLHAYWHLDGTAFESLPEQPLILRVYTMPDSRTIESYREQWFDMEVDASISQQTVTVPEAISGNYFSAAIGLDEPSLKRFAAVASSDTAYLPRTDIPVQKSAAVTMVHNKISASGKGKQL